MKNLFILVCLATSFSSVFSQDYWKSSEAGGKRMVALQEQIWTAGDSTLFLLDDEGNIMEDLYEKHGFDYKEFTDLSSNAGKVALSTRTGTYLFSSPTTYEFFSEVFESVCLTVDSSFYAGNSKGLFKRINNAFELISDENRVYELEKLGEEIFINVFNRSYSNPTTSLRRFKNGVYDTIFIRDIADGVGGSPIGGGEYRISSRGTFLRLGRNYVLEYDGSEWHYEEFENVNDIIYADFGLEEKLLVNPLGKISRYNGLDITLFSQKDGVLLSNTENPVVCSDVLMHNGNYYVLDDKMIYHNKAGVDPFVADHLYLDANTLKGRLSHNGNLFLDNENGIADLKIKDSSAFVFSANLWIAAKNEVGDLKTAYDTFGAGSSITPWESGMYNDDFSFNQPNFIKVTAAEIQYHRDNFNATTYEMPHGIQYWPGNGDVSKGEMERLAPYVDVDGNGFYSPNTGDYPAILGDQMIYIIVNDSRSPTGSNPDAIGLEMHISVFAWDSEEPYLANTFFTNHRIINRSGIDYPEFKAGFWMDTDLGNPSDDFMGCDSINNVFYTYNGDAEDDEFGGFATGFGVNPPAYGVKVLCDNMDGFMFYQLSLEPREPQDYYQLLNNRQIDSRKHMYNGLPSNYMYSGNPLTNQGDTEVNAGNIPNDRRGLMTFPKTSLMAGETISYTLAHGYARKENPNNYLENVGELISQLNQAEEFISSLKGTIPTYFPNSYACNLVGVDENAKNLDAVNLYPNPSNGSVSLRSSAFMQNVVVYSATGTLVHQQSISASKSAEVKLDKTLPNGIYLVEIKLQNGEKLRKKLSLMR
jgi:hypothetical protein